MRNSFGVRIFSIALVAACCVLLSSCLDFSGDWAQIYGPGELEGFPEGVVKLPCNTGYDWGPFTFVNQEFIPACIKGRHFSPGQKFFEGAGDACLSLMQRPGHENDHPIAFLLKEVGDAIEEFTFPSIIDGEMVIHDVGPVHWTIDHGISFWVDIGDGFEIPLDEPIEKPISFLLWSETYMINRIYLPMCSMRIQLQPELHYLDLDVHAWRNNTLRFSIADIKPIGSWTNPEFESRCQWKVHDPGCTDIHEMHRDWLLYHQCSTGSEENWVPMRVGYIVTVDGEEEYRWCRECSEAVATEWLQSIGEYSCLYTDNDEFDEIVRRWGNIESLWSGLQEEMSSILNKLLAKELKMAAQKILFDRIFLAAFGWDSYYMVVDVQDTMMYPEIEGEGVLLLRGGDPDWDGMWCGDGPICKDNCPLEPNSWQRDCDSDGQGDACDPSNCIGAISLTPTFHDALDDEQGNAQRAVGNWAKQGFSTTGGASRDHVVQHMAALAWCGCEDMRDAACIQNYCMEDGFNHQTDLFHGWYPETWFDGQSCQRDALGYCEPLPGVDFVRLNDNSSSSRTSASTNWDWRQERLPPDGEPVIENGRRYFKFRGFPVGDADYTPAAPESVYSFTPVTPLDYYVGPLQMGNFEQGFHLVPMGMDLMKLTAAVMGWFRRCATANDCLPEALVLTFDEVTGQLDRWLPSTYLEGVQDVLALEDQARVAVANTIGADWYTFGGVESDGTLSDALWHGVMNSPPRWEKLQPHGLETEVVEIPVGELPREILVRPLALLPDGDLAVVSNQASDDLSILSLSDRRVVASLSGFDGPLGLAIDDGRHQLWVANSGGESLSLVDLMTLEVIEEIDIPNHYPATLMIAPRVGKLFVGAWDAQVFGPLQDWRIFTLDLSTHEVGTNTIHYGGAQVVDAMALSPEQDRLYVARQLQKIDVYDTLTGLMVDSFSLGRDTTGLALTPDGGKMVIASGSQGLLSVYDAGTAELLGEVGGLPNATGIDMGPVGRTVLVTGYEGADGAQGRLWWVDLDNLSVIETFEVGNLPTTVAFYPAGGGACVVNTDSDSVSLVTNLGADGAMPAPRAGALLLADADRGLLSLAGGMGAQGVLDDRWTYELSSGLWRRKLSAGAVPAVAHASLARDFESGDTYVVGGLTAEGASNAVFRLGAGRVERLDVLSRASSPEPRSRAALAYLPELDALYVFGGLVDGQTLGDSWLFSLSQRSWRELSPPDGMLPTGRYSAAAVPLKNGKVAIFGGSSTEQAVDGHVWIQDLDTGSWREETETMPPVGARVGGLWRIDYLGKRLGSEVASAFDESALQSSMPHGPQRSLRWFGEFKIDESGAQRLHVNGKGGVRVFVDGRPWPLRGPAFGSCARVNRETAPLELSAGWHAIMLDWTVCKQGGELSVSHSIEGGPEEVIAADHLRHRWMGGLARKAYSSRGFFWRAASEDFDQTPIDDDWGWGAPNVLGLSARDRFAVVWDGELRIEKPGVYRFDVDVDDLGWLSIDGRDLWSGRGAKTSEGIWLDTGQHAIRFVAFDFFGPAHARLKVHKSSPDLGGLPLPVMRCSAPSLQ